MAWLHQNSVFAPVLALCQESSPERLGMALSAWALFAALALQRLSPENQANSFFW